VLRFHFTPAPGLTSAAGEQRAASRPPASRGGALQDCPPIRRLALAAALALCAIVAAVALAPAPAGARTGQLQQNRAEARELAADITALDARIDAAVTRYSRATQALEAVREQVTENRRLQRLAYQELGIARDALATRAVAMYKHEDVSPLDAVFGAADLGDLVTQLSMVRSIARCDRVVVRSIESTKQELRDRAAALVADERTAEKLVGTCRSELATIRSRLDERRAVLASVRADIRRLAAATAKSSPAPSPTVEPPDQGGGSGPWWPLIQSAAASNGVSARGMYRLMMVESGGSAAVAGPGGYYGLFQYSPATWKGSWNPWRSARISDGSAQIKATALAIGQGYGHAWWDPSYTWAFQGY
jgi:peptidoglycan hydrolase CwlO-like protein